MSLVTLDEYKTYARISGNEQNDRIQQYIDLCSKLVQTYIGQDVLNAASTPTTEVLEVLCGEVFPSMVPITEILTVTSLLPQYDVDDEPEYTITNLVDRLKIATSPVYALDEISHISLEYIGGYTTLPEDLKIAVMEFVTYYKEREHINNRSTKGDNEAYKVERVPEHIRLVLDLYRLVE